MSISSKHFIQNVDNYNTTFKDTCTTIFAKYMLIINEFLKHCIDNVFIQNKAYYVYVVKKGITTLTNVFKFLMLYTKNLDIMYHNCQKSYIYYIEFIGQIGEDNHSFLQLNSKDATLFVYKKTIFEISNDIRKDIENSKEDNIFIENVDSLMQIYNTIFFKYIEKNETTDVLKFTNTELQNTMQKIIKVLIDQNIENVENKINSMEIFVTHFKHENILDHLEPFIKKIKKKSEIDLLKLKHALLDEDNDNTTNPINPIKYINSIITTI